MKTIQLLITFLIVSITISTQAQSVEPAQLTNALVYVDHFLGSGKTSLVADVISMKRDSLTFRINGTEFAYSGHFSILLTTPRKHKNPYLGLGTPETAKFLTLEDFFVDQSDGTIILPNATIWEKSAGFIVAAAANKEWIHSGNYTITN